MSVSNKIKDLADDIKATIKKPHFRMTDGAKSYLENVYADLCNIGDDLMAPAVEHSGAPQASREDLIQTIVTLGRMAEKAITGETITEQAPVDIQQMLKDQAEKIKVTLDFADGYSQPVKIEGKSIRFSVVPKMIFPKIFNNDFSDPAWHSNFMINDNKYSGIIALFAEGTKSPFPIPNKNVWTSPVDGRLHYIHTKGKYAGWIEAQNHCPVDRDCRIYRDYGNESTIRSESKQIAVKAMLAKWGKIKRFKLA